MDIAKLRKEYAQGALDIADIDADPIKQFARWLNEALSAALPEPTAMSLATVAASGRPSSRIVLLKAFDARGFVFYTNYQSRKGREIAANPQVALLFHWAELEREVRIEGHAEYATPQEADRYFASRPRASRIGAIASPQSEVISARSDLERRFIRASEELGNDPPRPAYWGGYRVVPETMEFWQGRHSRLHDRLLYARAEGGWSIARLAP